MTSWYFKKFLKLITHRGFWPGVTFALPIALVPSAPADLFAAMGKNGQFIEVIPSLNIVVVRMGEAPDDKPVPISFHQEFWSQLGQIIK